MNTQYPRLRTGPLQPPGLFRLVTLLLLGSLFLTPRLSQAQTSPATFTYSGSGYPPLSASLPLSNNGVTITSLGHTTGANTGNGSITISWAVAAEPCGYTPTNVTVSGLSDCYANGVYTPNDLYNNTQSWKSGDNYIRWNNSTWEIVYDDGNRVIFIANAPGPNTTLPASGWVGTNICGVPNITLSGGVGSLAGGPSVTITPSSQTITSGGSVTLTASGATSYTWSNGQRTTAITVSPTSSTAFSVTGVTGTCSATASAEVNVSVTGGGGTVGQNGPDCDVYNNRTQANSGLGNTVVLGVHALASASSGITVFAATERGLGISTDGSSTFTNRTQANSGLGNNAVNGVYAVAGSPGSTTVYAATEGGGLSVSTDGGSTFTNRNTGNGLGNVFVLGVYAVATPSGTTVYAATRGGLSISTDGGSSFTNRTGNGLGDVNVNGVYALGSTVYAATSGGLSISTDGGINFTNKTKANSGLGSNVVLGVYAVAGSPGSTTVYAATDGGGLSISTDGGSTFTNRTRGGNGLGADKVWGVFVLGRTVYAATNGGLSISTDGGNNFNTKTASNNGIGSNIARGLYVVPSTASTPSTVFAATTGGLSLCPSVAIKASPSLTIASGGSVTLTASGADTYTWNDGSTTNPLVLTNVTSATTVFVVGVAGTFSGTATAQISVTTLTFCNTIAYVTPTGNGTKDGSSWANALPGEQFPQALATACSGTTFLVGGGLYKPGTGTVFTESFTIPSGVEVYGGYAVTGSTATRGPVDPTAGTPSSTTFSGEIGDSDLTSDNNLHVVSIIDASTSTRLDGVVITAGYAGIEGDGSRGAGIFNVRSSPVIANCLLTGNYASSRGGAFYNRGSDTRPASPSLTHCAFTQNTANTGGAIYNNQDGGDAFLTILNCQFRNNSALGSGGALSGGGVLEPIQGTGVVSITGSTFTGNTAQADGGAIYGLNPVAGVQSSTFTGNSAGDNGGAIYDYSSSLTLTGSLMSQNVVGGNGGAIYTENSSMTITSSSLTQNTAAIGGGAIKNAGASRLTINNSVLSHNQISASNGRGGAIHNGSGGDSFATLVMESTTLTQNSSLFNGGAIYNDFDAVATLTNCLLSNNVITGDFAHGGAVYNDGGTITRFTSCTFSQNKGLGSSSWGGAIHNNAVASAAMINCAFSQNAAVTGGAVYNSGGTASYTLTGCSFSQNTATNANFDGGGAVYNNAVKVDVVDSRFIGNEALIGGGLYNNQGAVNVRNCYFEQNRSTGTTASSHGGGALLHNGQSAATRIESCTFVGNAAQQIGGGIWSDLNFNPLSITGCQFSQNSANVGGGMYLYGSPTVTNCRFTQNTATNGAGIYSNFGFTSMPPIVNSMFSRNVATGSGAGLYLDNTSFKGVNLTFSGNTAPAGSVFDVSVAAYSHTLQNSIIWNNTPVANTFAGLDPSKITLQNSLIDPAAGTTYTDGGNNKTADPLFTNEAGDDLTLTGCSPAINAGSNARYTAANGPVTDLAGLTRPSDATVDMGAYEFQGTPGSLTITVAALPSQTITSGGSVTLTASNGTSYTWSNGRTENPLVLTNVTSATTLSVTGTTGTCSGTASVAVSVSCPALSPLITASGSLTLCKGTSTTLNASVESGATLAYAWSNGETTPAISVSPTSTSAYQVTVTNTTTGCFSITGLTVTVDAPVTASIGAAGVPGNQTICPGTSTTLTASGGDTFLWSNGSALSAITVSPTSMTAYQVTVSSGSCSATATAIVTFYPAVTATIVPSSVTICPGNSATLTASGGSGLPAGPGGSYRWSTGETTASISVMPMSSQPYTVTATSTDGCSGTATATVSVTSPIAPATPTLSASSSAVCEGATVVVLGNTTGMVTSYQWYKDGQMVSGQSSATLSLNGVQAAQAGGYTLTILGVCGSATSTTFTLTMNPLPTVTIVFPTSASVNPVGPVVTVPVGTGLSYQVFGGGSNGRYERKIVLDRIGGYEIRTTMENTTGLFPLDKAGPYTITVTDGNGCQRTVTGVIKN